MGHIIGTPSRKVYLGDAVYVEWDGEHFLLTTEDGIKTLDKVYLEPRVYVALRDYVDKA